MHLLCRPVESTGCAQSRTGAVVLNINYILRCTDDIQLQKCCTIQYIDFYHGTISFSSIPSAVSCVYQIIDHKFKKAIFVSQYTVLTVQYIKYMFRCKNRKYGPLTILFISFAVSYAHLAAGGTFRLESSTVRCDRISSTLTNLRFDEMPLYSCSTPMRSTVLVLNYII